MVILGSDSAFLMNRDLFAAENSLPKISIWETLDQFAASLYECEQIEQQLHLTLQALKESLRADLVFWDPGETDEPGVQIGPPEMDRNWCSQLIGFLFNQTPGIGSQLLKSCVNYSVPTKSMRLESVALVRISERRGIWMGAVSVTPDRIFQPEDLKMMSLIRRLLVNHRHYSNSQDRLRHTLQGLLLCLGTTIDAKERNKLGHSPRVAYLAELIGHDMKLPQASIRNLYLSALLHDIGKLRLQDEAFSTRSTESSMKEMRQHPTLGDELLRTIPALSHLREGIRHHHERFDGTGYPDRLVGERIPWSARIIGLANDFDNLMCKNLRFHSAQNQITETILKSGAGTRWDSKMVNHLLNCRERVNCLYEHMTTER